MGESAKEGKCIEMHLNDVFSGYVCGEFCISHPGISKDDGECIELPSLSVNINISEFSEIHLGMSSQFCFISDHSIDGTILSQGTEIILVDYYYLSYCI